MGRSAKMHLGLISVALLAVAGLAQGYGGGSKAKAAAKGVVEATLTGRNTCLACALKAQEGAAAQCSVYGHRHVLVVKSAVGTDGKPIAGAKKWVLHYLENDQSKDLIAGHHGESLVVTGKVYPKFSTLEVVSYEPAPAETAKPEKATSGHEGT